MIQNHDLETDIDKTRTAFAQALNEVRQLEQELDANKKECDALRKGHLEIAKTSIDNKCKANDMEKERNQAKKQLELLQDRYDKV